MPDEGTRPGQPSLHVELFECYIERPENWPLYSLQEAFERYLVDEGFDLFGDNYSAAVQVILVYLSRAVVNPNHRTYCCDPNNDLVNFATLQVTAPSDDDLTRDVTFWEFFTKESFHKLYQDWKSSQGNP